MSCARLDSLNPECGQLYASGVGLPLLIQNKSMGWYCCDAANLCSLMSLTASCCSTHTVIAKV
jgi:hypothetical protein